MEGGGWFNAQTQRVSKAHGAITQPVGREAARFGRPGRGVRAGTGSADRGSARESAPERQAPADLGGGRLTPAAERLHGEDAPPAQHGPAPGPDAAPRPRPQQPARNPGPASPRRCLAGGFARASGPGWARPADPPGGERGEGGEGRAGVRAAGGGGAPGAAAGGGGGAWEPGRAGRAGEPGKGLDPPSFGLRAAPRSRRRPRSGDPRLRTLSGSRCGVTRHPPLPVHMLVCLPAAEMQPGMGVEGRRGLDGSAEGNGAPRAGCGKSADRDRVVPALPAVCLGQVTQPLRKLTRWKGEVIPVRMEILSNNCRAP